MKRLLVNDCLTCIPGTRTFWHDLQEWFGLEFRGGDYSVLSLTDVRDASLVIRNATWFPAFEARVPTISLLQDIIESGPTRDMQEQVIRSSAVVCFNSEYTKSKYATYMSAVGVEFGVKDVPPDVRYRVIPLPVDFALFTPGDSVAARHKLSLPDGCVCWVGASRGAAGHVKGWDVFMQIVRLNPDLPFVAVLKDEMPNLMPPNLRCFVRLSHEELVDVYRACRVGLCTSRQETQHLAGIEMGACGLPMVAPPVGCYYGRDELGFPGVAIDMADTTKVAIALRSNMKPSVEPNDIRDFWRAEFDKPVIRAKWQALIEEVECSGQS